MLNVLIFYLILVWKAVFLVVQVFFLVIVIIEGISRSSNAFAFSYQVYLVTVPLNGSELFLYSSPKPIVYQVLFFIVDQENNQFIQTL